MPEQVAARLGEQQSHRLLARAAARVRFAVTDEVKSNSTK
jgi:hypothetical protein